MDVPHFDPAPVSWPRGVRRVVFDSPFGPWSLSFAPAPAALHGVVARLWETHGFVDYSREKLLPSENLELIVNLGLPHGTLDPETLAPLGTFRAAWLSGLQEGPLVAAPTYDAREHGSLFVGASLDPSAASSLFGVPAHVFTNRVVELSEVIGPGLIERLRERLYHAPRTAERFGVLGDELRRWRGVFGREPTACVVGSMEALRRRGGSGRVERLCEASGVSRKHLAARFREEVGVSPKRYARLLRFRALVDRLTIGGRPDWAELALSCGYYDQAHLAKEFRGFTGETPGQFVGRRAPDGQSILYE